MTRKLYLATLCLLQAGLAAHLVPPLAASLRHQSALGATGDAWMSAAQIAAAGLAVLGMALALGYPGLALLGHHRRGALRFIGLPEWAVALALAGAVVFASGVAWTALLSLPSAGAWQRASIPLMPAGLALMVAGTLSAEMLRRGVPPWAVCVAQDNLDTAVRLPSPRGKALARAADGGNPDARAAARPARRPAGSRPLTSQPSA